MLDPGSNPFSALSLIVAPAVLTNACSVLTMGTGNRLARAVDRARELTASLEQDIGAETAKTQMKLQDLRGSQQRVLMLIRALQLFYAALGCFASAALLSLLGASFRSHVSPPVLLVLELVSLAAGTIAVLALSRGALLLVRETRIAVATLEDEAREVEHQFSESFRRIAGKS